MGSNELCMNSRYEMLQYFLRLFAAVQVQFDPQNYTVTEGDVVNITLVTNTSDYMFDFTVTLQIMDGTATGESSTACSSYSTYFTVHLVVASLFSTFHSQQLAVTMKLVRTL